MTNFHRLIFAPTPQGSRGVALILVIFIITLASIVVVNLTYSTHLGARLNAAAQRSVQAEYLLKSALNLARVLIRADKSSEDEPQDPWALFRQGAPIPAEYLGLDLPNVRIELEIRTEESKFPLRALVPLGSSQLDERWRDAIASLFEKLGFDDDEEVDHTGLFPGRKFSSKEMVAMLIDFQDQDSESYEGEDFLSGFEGEGSLPKDTFPVQSIERLGDLASIPGFSAARLAKLTPFVTAFPTYSKININLAPKIVLESLHSGIGPAEAQRMIDFRGSEEGPFRDQNKSEQLSQIVSEDVYQEISGMVTTGSSIFQVVSKVDYGTSLYFLRAYLMKAPGANNLPKIRSLELY